MPLNKHTTQINIKVVSTATFYIKYEIVHVSNWSWLLIELSMFIKCLLSGKVLENIHLIINWTFRMKYHVLFSLIVFQDYKIITRYHVNNFAEYSLLYHDGILKYFAYLPLLLVTVFSRLFILFYELFPVQ